MRSTNVQSLKAKIHTFIQVCNYLSNEGLHKIPNKRKINKEMHRSKRHNEFAVRIQTTKRQVMEADLVRSRRTHIANRPVEEITVELPVFRIMLLNLIS